MKKLILLVLILTALPYSIAMADQFKVGDTIPSFDLPYATKDTIVFEGISSDQLNGKWYILAFYPADWSGGCTSEMCTFRDEFSFFDNLEIEVFPISGDNVFSHHEWAKHLNLGFRMLSDNTREFGKTMGVYMDKYGMFKRSVFVVDPTGKLAYVDYDYSLANNDDYNALKEFVSQKKSNK